MTRRSAIVRVAELLGSRVRSAEGAVIGTLEEVRADRRGDDHEITEYVVAHNRILMIARWDQLDIHNPATPTLTCPVEELRHEE